jgi:hypothetical protein
MRLVINAVVLSFILAAHALPSRPGTDGTVQFLREDCRAPHHSSQEAQCLGYIRGAADQLFAQEQICLAAPSAGEAGVQAFLDWADKHPQSWGVPTWTGVMAALVQAWPCREG